MHFYPVDGAARRVDRHETAFSYREAKWSMVIVGVDPDPANAEKITRWTEDYWAAVHPYSLGGLCELHDGRRTRSNQSDLSRQL